MTEQPYDVVEYWHGHEHCGAVGPYDVLHIRHVKRILRYELRQWAFLQFRLRNGQVIRVRPKSIPATARCE